MSREISYTRNEKTVTIRMTDKGIYGAVRDACNLTEDERESLRRWIGSGCAHPHLEDITEGSRAGILTRCEDCRRQVLILAENGKRYLLERRVR